MPDLFIPHKNASNAHGGYATDMRAIELWSKNVGSNFYKSLTGPGETNSPGDLTQLGGFTVDDSLGDGIILDSQDRIDLEAVNVILIQTTAVNSILQLINSGGSIDLFATGGISIDPSLGGSEPGNTLGFFDVAGSSQPTITGSRGGNAALANLLVALDSFGLIKDSTTP